jgi:2-amino-4-hydroxy-6-hydroxymethyldihydropteridine diphosphokinase
MNGPGVRPIEGESIMGGRGIIAHLGLGSNVESPHGNCLEAIGRLSRHESIRPVQCSPFYRTEPVGYREQDWFVNAVVEVRTTLSPHDLLDALQAVETDMGRVRTVKDGPRVIDLDILFYNQDVMGDEKWLVIPHPELHRRRFVLVPLNDIASWVIHPAFGVSVRGLLERCTDTAAVQWFGEPVHFE